MQLKSAAVLGGLVAGGLWGIYLIGVGADGSYGQQILAFLVASVAGAITMRVALTIFRNQRQIPGSCEGQNDDGDASK